MEFKYKNKVISIDEVPKNDESWIIIKDEKYKPDKDYWLFTKFTKDYPSVPVKDIKQIHNLASRSTHLSEWLAVANVEYSKIEDTPTYFRDFISKDEYENIANKMRLASKVNIERAEKEYKASIEYRNKLRMINEEYNTKYSSLIDDPITQIIMLKGTDLPLSIQLAIDNFTPAKTSGSPDKKVYAREMLIRFKVSLIKFIKTNPEYQVSDLIENLRPK